MTDSFAKDTAASALQHGLSAPSETRGSEVATAMETALAPANVPLVGRLQQTIDAIEGAFLNAGNVLSTAVDGVGELISGIDRLTAAIDPQMVAWTTDDLKRAASSLHELPRLLAGRREELEAMRMQAGVLGGSVADMKRSLSYLGVFTIYVKVAASDVTQAREQFTAFAEEIGVCIARGRTHINGFEADLSALDAALARAVSLDDGLAVECASLLPSIPNAIIAAASGLSDHRQKAVSAAASVRSLASSVRGKVGSVLAALQIGDITRQRLEHVRDGLRALHQEAAAVTGPRQARFLTLGYRFLDALLASAVEDFRCEIQQIGRSMAGLASDAEQVLALLEVAYGRSQDRSMSQDGDRNFIDDLEAHVGRALNLVGKVQTVEQTAAHLGHSATEAALRLTARIGDIQALQRDVQQMALNTRLKCSQVGEVGRSLAVIALEIREQTLDLEAAATQAMDCVSALEGQAEALSHRVAAAKDTGARTAASSLNLAVGRLRHAGENVSADQGGLAKLGRSVVRGLQSAASGIDFEVSISSVLDEAVLGLAQFANAETTYDEAIMAPTQAFLQTLSASYTMAQERSVHQVIAAAFNIPTATVITSAPAQAEVADDFDLDDLLF